MADEQVIITKFVADTGQFEAGVDAYVNKLTEAEGAVKKTDAAEKTLATTTGNLADKFEATAVAAQNAKQSTDDLGKNVVKSGSLFDQAKAKVAQFGKSIQTSLKNARQNFATLPGLTKTLSGAFSGIATGAGKAFGALGNSVKGVVGAIPGIGGIATALGPVGIAVGAISAGLLKVITNFSAGEDAVRGLGIAAGVAFDKFSGKLANEFDRTQQFFSSFATEGTVIGSIIDGIGESITFIVEKLTPIGPLLNSIGFGAEDLKESFGFGQEIAESQAKLEDTQRAVNEATAENDLQQAKLLVQLNNQNLSAEERLRIADDITKIEQDNLKLKTDQLKAELGILEAQAAQQKLDKGDIDGELKKQISQIKVALTNAERESVALTEKVSVRRQNIIAGEESKKQAIRDKAAQERKKAEEEEAKRSEQRVEAQSKLNELLEQLNADRLTRQQTEDEKEVTAAQKKYEDLEEVAREGIAKLRAVSPPQAAAAIAEQEKNILVQIANAKTEELLAIEKKQKDEQTRIREEGTEELRRKLLDETELAREDRLVQLDEDIALAEKTIENVEERNEIIRQLVEKAQKDLTDIVSTEEQKRLDAEKKAAEEALALKQQQFDTIKNAAADGLALVIQAAASGEEEQKKSSKALLLLLLDTLEKIIMAQAFSAQAMVTGAPTPDNIASGGISGTLKGIAMFALVKGMFTAAKALITANYTGDPFVGGDGSKPMWSGRDGFLRRLDYGERVVTGKTNAKYFDEMQAMEDGNWDSYIDKHYLMPAIEALRYNDDAKAVKFAQTDMGQRMAASITLPRMFDKGIVNSQMQVQREQRKSNALLEALVQNTRPRRINKRYY
jgi:hypothetical protein